MDLDRGNGAGGVITSQSWGRGGRCEKERASEREREK